MVANRPSLGMLVWLYGFIRAVRRSNKKFFKKGIFCKILRWTPINPLLWHIITLKETAKTVSSITSNLHP